MNLSHPAACRDTARNRKELGVILPCLRDPGNNFFGIAAAMEGGTIECRCQGFFPHFSRGQAFLREHRASIMHAPKLSSIAALSVAAVCLLCSPPCADCQVAARVDRYGDPLPDGAPAAHRQHSAAGHRHGAALAFRHDGKGLVSIDAGTGGHVWDAATGQDLSAFGSPPGMSTIFELSADGSLAAMAESDNLIHIYDTATGAPAACLRRSLGEAQKTAIVAGP